MSIAISKSTGELSCTENSSRFHIVRVAKACFEEFDPLSNESEEVEVTVTPIHKSNTDIQLNSSRRRSFQKGRFSVAIMGAKSSPEEQPEIHPTATTVINLDDDDLLKF